MVGIALLGTLAACTTPPKPTEPDLADSSWKTETFYTANPVVPVTVAILEPPPNPAQVGVSGRYGADRPEGGDVLGGEDGSDAALHLGTTPWRRSLTGRRPVGVVVESGRVTSNPVSPYWALILRTNGRWEMVAQRELNHMEQRHETGEIQVAVGGFYPLILEGRVVSGQFPGTTIRAARVAIGGTDGADQRLVIVATGTEHGATAGGDPVTNASDAAVGNDVAGDSPDAQGGLTTGELARLLQHYDLDWALNLDGGRSAYLRFPNGAVRPTDVFLRRPGPVLLHMIPPEPDLLQPNRSEREMIE